MISSGKEPERIDEVDDEGSDSTDDSDLSDCDNLSLSELENDIYCIKDEIKDEKLEKTNTSVKPVKSRNSIIKNTMSKNMQSSSITRKDFSEGSDSSHQLDTPSSKMLYFPNKNQDNLL